MPHRKQRAPLYGTGQWQRLVASIVRERGRRCEDPQCRSPNRGRGERIHADHVVELRDGGAEFDRRNIMLRCSACHIRKTRLVAKLRQAAAIAANWQDWEGWRGDDRDIGPTRSRWGTGPTGA